MAARQACQRLALRRITPRMTAAAAAPATVAAARASAMASAMVRPVPSSRPKEQSRRAGVMRWYSGSADQVPDSRIWGFDEIKTLVEREEDSKEKVILVDVREPSELLDTGKIPGAINIPITSAVQSFHISDEDFEDMHGYARPPKDAPLVFYCKAGVRAKAAAALAQHAGWESVGEYPGSWLDWDKNKGPVEVVKQGKKDS